MFFGKHVQASNRVILYLNSCFVRPGSSPVADHPVFSDVLMEDHIAAYCPDALSCPAHGYAPLAQVPESFPPFACAWTSEDQPMLCELLQALRPHLLLHTRQC